MKALKLLPLFVGAALLMAQPALAGDGHGTKHGGKFAGHEVPELRLLKGLDLTDSQREQIRSLMKEAHTDKPDPASRSAAHQAMQALVKAEQFDEVAARQLLEKQQPQMLEQQLKRLKLQHQIRTVLTDEQKAKLDERAAKMQQRMAERAEKNAGEQP